MVKIRKKSSSRQTTAMRAKISRKSAEHVKKGKKASKKDVTWKSSQSSPHSAFLDRFLTFFVFLAKPKDIGIPSMFPYKDQVLAEAAAEKVRVSVLQLQYDGVGLRKLHFLERGRKSCKARGATSAQRIRSDPRLDRCSRASPRRRFAT